jgi:hypothetical protein
LPNLLSLTTCCVSPEPGPLPSTGITRFQRYYGPLRHPTAPGSSLAGLRLVIADHACRVSRVAYASLVYLLSPLPRRSGWGLSSLLSPVVSTFPALAGGSARASSFSRLARRSLGLQPAHSRCHHNSWLAFQRLQPLRYLHSCSGCFRLELSPGGALTHWEAPPLHGARQLRTFDRANSLP